MHPASSKSTTSSVLPLFLVHDGRVREEEIATHEAVAVVACFPLAENKFSAADVAGRASKVQAVLFELHDGTKAALHTLAQALHPRLVPLVALVGEHPSDEITALDAGADLAVPLPLNAPLLRARVRAWHRSRTATPDASEKAPEATQASSDRLGPLHVNHQAQQFYVDETPIALTPREFGVMDLLMQKAGTCCTRDEILDAVWSPDFHPNSNMIDVYIYFLRRKLKEHGFTGVIRTVRGRGYRLDPPGNVEENHRDEA